MEGWIKLHRQLKEHWIWKSDNRLKWWIDILFTVNHSDSKVLIKGTLIECKRGQSIRSLDSWAKDWNVSKGAVRDFFKLLQSDQMLYTESLQFTTRITVCKYEDYQDVLYIEKTQKKRKKNDEETLGLPKQECKEEIKNEKNVNKLLQPTLIEVSEYCSERQNKVDPEKWFDYYTSNGWMVGKNKMKDWKAAIRTWEKNTQQNGQTINGYKTDKLAGTKRAAENLAREIKEKSRGFVNPYYKPGGVFDEVQP